MTTIPPPEPPKIEDIENYHPNGKLKEKGMLVKGKKEGLWTSWWENGQKMWELTFKDGKEDGLYTSWFENGQKRGERIYVDGFIDDLKGWNIYGQINQIHLYKNGLPHGKHIDIEEDGGKRIEYYEFGEKKYIEKLDKNGRQISYKEGDFYSSPSLESLTSQLNDLLEKDGFFNDEKRNKEGSENEE